MNILSYSHAYVCGGHNGGAETTLHDVMRLLREEKHKTTALLSKPHPDGSGPYILDGVMVQSFSSKRDPELYIPDNDITLTQLECAARAGMLAEKAGKKSVQLIHNDQSYCIKSAGYNDALIFNTEWVKPAYDHLSLPGVVFHPPIEPLRYKTETTREFITIVNLTVGTENRMSYNKGAETFYELARLFPDERFLGVKGGYGEQYVPDDLPPNVTIMEHTNNPIDYLSRTKILLCPSRYESYGRSAIEASASGIPSLCTRTPGTLEGVGRYQTTIEGFHLFEWARGLRYLLDREVYQWFSKEAIQGCNSLWSRSGSEWADVLMLLESL